MYPWLLWISSCQPEIDSTTSCLMCEPGAHMCKATGLTFSLCCSFGHSKGHATCRVLSWHNVCLIHNTKHYSAPKLLLVWSHFSSPRQTTQCWKARAELIIPHSCAHHCLACATDTLYCSPNCLGCLGACLKARELWLPPSSFLGLPGMVIKMCWLGSLSLPTSVKPFLRTDV